MSKNIYVVFFQRVLYEGELCLITHNEASLCFCAYDSSDNRIYVLEFMWLSTAPVNPTFMNGLSLRCLGGNMNSQMSWLIKAQRWFLTVAQWLWHSFTQICAVIGLNDDGITGCIQEVCLCRHRAAAWPLCFRYYEHYKLSTCGNCFIPCQQQREHIFKDDLCHGNMQNGCLSFLSNYNSFFPPFKRETDVVFLPVTCSTV